MITEDNAKYPKANFSTVEALRKHYECHPTAHVSDDLAIHTEILEVKVSKLALSERVKDGHA